jgi:spermidine/putrescine transport system permease protein
MFGDYFTNTMLSGSPSTTMIGNLIDDSISSTGQGPEAAVLILILMIMLLIPIWYYLRSTARAAEAR